MKQVSVNVFDINHAVKKSVRASEIKSKKLIKFLIDYTIIIKIIMKSMLTRASSYFRNLFKSDKQPSIPVTPENFLKEVSLTEIIDSENFDLYTNVFIDHAWIWEFCTLAADCPHCQFKLPKNIKVLEFCTEFNGDLDNRLLSYGNMEKITFGICFRRRVADRIPRSVSVITFDYHYDQNIHGPLQIPTDSKKINVWINNNWYTEKSIPIGLTHSTSIRRSLKTDPGLKYHGSWTADGRGSEFRIRKILLLLLNNNSN